MRISLVLLPLLAALAGPALADDGFRCRTGRLVSVGDRMSDVRNRCGEPDAMVERIERRKVKHRFTRRIGNVEESVTEEEEIEIPINEWTYDLGPGAFIRYVIFESGAVVNVATGEYGRR
jgi:hypothetical protein